MEHQEAQHLPHDEDHPSYSERCLCKGKAFHDFMVQCVICEDWFHGLCLKPQLPNEKAVELWEKQHGMEWTCPNCMGADDESD